MTPPDARTAPPTTRRRFDLALAVIATITAGAAVMLAGAGTAAAEQVVGDRQSPAAAAAAERALIAYDDWQRSSTWIAGQQFENLLVEAAEVTATEVGVDPAAMTQAWVAADEPHRVAVLTGVAQLGTDYRDNGDSPSQGFDCSGFTSWAWRKAGVELPRSSGDQIAAADSRDPANAMAGDLVQYPGHVMMYLGVDQVVVHSSNEENDVELWALSGDRSYSYGDPT